MNIVLCVPTFVMFIVILLALVSVTGCGGSSSNSNSNIDDTEQPVVELTEAEDGCTVGDKLVGTAMTAPDFNGDGCDDLAIGSPYKDLTSEAGDGHGQVTILYGTDQGLLAVGIEIWYRGGGFDYYGNSLGDLEGTITDFDNFGYALAWGDFNADGYSDLAISIPGDNSGSSTDGGSVQVIYGTASGLRATNTQYITQAGVWTDPEGDGTGSFQGDIYGGIEDGDRFGLALAAGDFNGDGYFDLAIGSPNEDIGSADNGAVNVLFGSDAGLAWQGNQFLTQDEVRRENDGTNSYTVLGDLLGVAEADDLFGDSLAAGDIDNDGFDDLVIGAPGEAIGSVTGAGAINLVRGSANGLVATGNQHFHQQRAYTDSDGDGSVDIDLGAPSDTEETGDNLGRAVAVGDFNGDGFADVAVGVVNEDLATIKDAGLVQVWYGSASGVTLDGQNAIQQDAIYRGGAISGMVAGSAPEGGDAYGYALSTGDFNSDGYDDLVVGAPGENNEVTANIDTGSVSLWFGAAVGLQSKGHLYITPDQVILDDGSNLGGLVISESGNGDQFGGSLTSADFDDDGFIDLAIGVPGYSPSDSQQFAGALAVLHGGSEQQIGKNQFWDQDGGMDDTGADLGDLNGGSSSGDQFARTLP